jgi:two-component sensor histidine kinase
MKPDVTRRTGPSARMAFLMILWRQPLWAIPFALFFGTMFGSGFASYVLAYKMSLVFAYLIGLGLWVAHYIVLRDYYACDEMERETPVLRLVITYSACSLVPAYIASAIIHFTLMPGFLGGPRQVAVSGMFTLLFTALFSGISFAASFYRQSMARARQVEGIRAELAEAELRALRAQIHPHFLFNTLNTIAALIHEDPSGAEDTTTRLAEVFRYTLRASDHEYARFADELQFVRDYLEIERTRFRDRLRIEEQVEPGLENISIPSLLLQPLVENAVRHGIAPRAEGGTVRLSARRARAANGSGSTLEIEIADDGPGVREGAPSGAGFGLRSVRERIELAGPPHALAIESAAGRGTIVRLTLPIPTPAT